MLGCFRFNAEENLSGPLGQIIHSRLSANADINVLNISGEAVPIIYATKIIKKTELIFLSKRKIAALNRDFVTWYENKTGWFSINNNKLNYGTDNYTNDEYYAYLQ